jgi:hypothetical protein
MPKRQKRLQDIELAQFRETYGSLTLRFWAYDRGQRVKSIEGRKTSQAKIPKEVVFDTMAMARLLQPDKYKYKHKSRLRRTGADTALRCLETVSRIMQVLPDNFRLEIISDPAYQALTSQVLKEQKKVKETKDNMPLGIVALNYHFQLLVNGLLGIKEMMPEEFTQVLFQQMQPVLLTMQSISSYARANNPKNKIPTFVIPSELLPSPPSVRT